LPGGLRSTTQRRSADAVEKILRRDPRHIVFGNVRVGFLRRDCFATEGAMRRINRAKYDYRVPIAIARSARKDNRELLDIATLSLAGLAATLFLIAQYVGSGVLRQMFAL
jgi:hypothetical protein